MPSNRAEAQQATMATGNTGARDPNYHLYDNVRSLHALVLLARQP